MGDRPLLTVNPLSRFRSTLTVKIGEFSERYLLPITAQRLARARAIHAASRSRVPWESLSRRRQERYIVKALERRVGR